MSFYPRIVTIQSAKGGVGCSVVAANTALGMVYETKKPVCLIEFDVIHGGCQAGLFNIEPEVSKVRNIRTLFESGKVTRETFLKNVIKHKTGVSILSAETAEELESLSTRQVIDILSIAGSIFENIVIDLAQPYISEELITTFDFSSVVGLVITPDIVTFEHTQKFLELMKDLNFPSSKFQVLLNMFGSSKAELEANTLESYLERKFFAKLPYDHTSTLTGINTGVPVLQNNFNTELGRAYYEMARNFVKVNPTDLNNAIKAAMETAKRFDADKEHHQHHSPVQHSTPTPNINHSDNNPNPYGLPKDVIKSIKAQTHKQLVSEMRLDKLSHIDLNDPVKKADLKEQITNRIAMIFDHQNIELPGRTERAELIKDIANEALGLGPLENLLEDPTVTEIMVNGVDKIYIEKSGKISLFTRTFTDEKQLRVVIDRIVAPIGRRIDESSPYVDARLLDGSRVNIIIPPLALDGPSLTIRRFPQKRLEMTNLVEFGALTNDMAEFLAACVIGKMNIFISGGTGSGKTTLLNILSSFIPNDERIVTIEDAAELRLNQEHIVRLEARPANIEGKGAVTIRDLVKNSLRMRPDRVVIGEIRGGEALDMLQAMNTGHDGSLATGHANTPRDALSRIETMVLMAGMDLPVRAIREQISSAINIIVQQSRLRDGSRKITKIVEITGMEGEIISTQEIFSYEMRGMDENGKLIGEFTATNIRPKIVDQFESRGAKLPSFFTPEKVMERLKANSRI